jgi:hypothetical protein
MIKGAIISTTEYLKVKAIGTDNGKRGAIVENIENGQEFFLTESLWPAYVDSGEFTTEEVIGKKEAEEKFTSIGDKVFTVNYDTQLDAETVVETLKAMSISDIQDAKKLKPALKGKERTLRGRMVNPIPVLGRVLVVDLDIDRSKHRERLVDLRGLNWFIVAGVKYKVKK